MKNMKKNMKNKNETQTETYEINSLVGIELINQLNLTLMAFLKEKLRK